VTLERKMIVGLTAQVQKLARLHERSQDRLVKAEIMLTEIKKRWLLEAGIHATPDPLRQAVIDFLKGEEVKP